MQRRIGLGITAFGLAVSVALPAAAQRTTESTTLFVCQKQAGAQAGRYAFVRQRLLGLCLARAAADVVLQNEPAIDVERSARGCIGVLYALGRSDGRAQGDIMEDRINRFCDPGESFPQHSEDDTLGTGSPGVNQSLDAATLDSYCGSLATGSSTLTEWVECLRAAAECTAHQQIATQYPRVLEWLNLIDAELATSTHPFAAEARAELQAVEAAIDGGNDDDSPDIHCGPGLVAGLDPILPATGQTTSYGTGSDGDLQGGQTRSFTDNGDGTITDNTTGLVWEKKEDFDNSAVTCKTEGSDPSCENPHDADNRYEWCEDVDDSGGCDNGGDPFDGPVVTLFLDQLNNRCDDDVSVDCTTSGDADCSGVGGECGFAGHRDWRLPNIKELLSLVDYETFGPSTFGAFDAGCSASCNVTDADTCSCTVSSFYWSSSTQQDFPINAWGVYFIIGSDFVGNKDNLNFARAVRGGL